MTILDRRQMFGSAVLAAAAILPAKANEKGANENGKKQDEKEVGAVEDLMREHGVLRRVLLIYRQSVPKLRADPGGLDASSIRRAAQLFRDFGEEYHEKKLEEAFIFPRLKKAGGPNAELADVLLTQHRRGREITAFILNATGGTRVGTADGESLARAFETMALMYQNHAAREDTVLFPAWKEVLSADELKEMGEKFEDIEKQQFGGDGFDKSVKEIAAIEARLGFADLAQFTAPRPA